MPGKVVYNMDEIITALADNDFESEKTENFKKEFFDDFDGNSGRRVCQFIEKLMG